MSRFFTYIVKSARIMALMGMMATLVAVMAGAPSASAAARISPSGAVADGKLSVFVSGKTAIGSGGIAGASIQVTDSPGQLVAQGTTDSKGSFSGYVPEGTYKLRITAGGFQEFSTYIKIAAGQTTSVRAQLQPVATPVPASTATPVPASVADAVPGKLSVHVSYATPTSAYIQATVSVFDAAGNGVAKGYADASGNFTVKLTQGRYTVLVSASGFKDSKAEIDIVSNQTTQVNLTLSPVSTDTN